MSWLKKATVKDGKLVLPFSGSKAVLELLGVPHKLAGGEFVVIGRDDSLAVLASMGVSENLGNIDDRLSLAESESGLQTLEVVNKLSSVTIRDKCGTFIGARMGRPEKAKMRKLAGSPHVLFPVGAEGGRFRSFQEAVERGKVRAGLSYLFLRKVQN